MIDECGSGIADCGMTRKAIGNLCDSAFPWLFSLLLLLFVVPAFANDIPALIEQLGDPRYAERRDAQRQLVEIGLRAYDSLDAATESSDPEIAATSRRLLGELTLRWDWAGDPRMVRQQLDGYGEQPEAERMDRFRSFGMLREDQGVPALCRIVRYDLSPRVSREAARVLLNIVGKELSAERREAIAKASARLDQDFGPSRRTAAGWLALAADSSASTDRWREIIDRETTIVQRNDGRSDQVVLTTLTWQWLREGIAKHDEEAIVAATARLTEASSEFAEIRLGRALQWMAEAQLWSAMDAILDQEKEHLQTKRSLYLQARLFSQRGQDERAEELAEQAFASEETGNATLRENEGITQFGLRSPIANELRKKGFSAWAEREYAEASRRLDPLSTSAAYARWQLADLLQDSERYGEAAQQLAGLNQAIHATKESLKAYRKLAAQGRSFLQAPSTIAAKEAMYRALDHRRRGESVGEIEALRQAIELEPGDADIVIAMYRFEDADAALIEEVHERIAELCQRFEEDIADQPMEPSSFNQWAWLVGNTTGDFAKAVRYSERSLELIPDEAGFLDTLGRCHYAAGDFDAALKAQRRAIEQQPNMLVMQRQLAMIEAAQREKKLKGN